LAKAIKLRIITNLHTRIDYHREGGHITQFRVFGFHPEYKIGRIWVWQHLDVLTRRAGPS